MVKHGGSITIPASSLAGAQIVQAGSTNTTSNSQGTVTVTLPVSGNMVNAGGMVMVRPCAEVSSILLPYLTYLHSHSVVEVPFLRALNTVLIYNFCDNHHCLSLSIVKLSSCIYIVLVESYWVDMIT